MANRDHLKRLSDGLRTWNAWRTYCPHETIDLSHTDLLQANLRRFNLQGAALRGARLSGADLREADLTSADLAGAVLERADLSGACLRGTDLSDSDLSDARLVSAYLGRTLFTRAYMRGADLTGAVLDETVFGGTVLAAAVGLDECEHAAPCTIDHRTLATLTSSTRLPEAFLRRLGLSSLVVDYLPSLLNRPIEYYKCFISYSHDDARFARALYDQLQAKGVSCWLDEHHLRPGDDIHSTVVRVIRARDKVLLCCSRQSLTSWWVDAEIEAAFAKERRLMGETGVKSNVVIPLDLDGYLGSEHSQNPRIDTLRSRKAADFRNWEAEPEQFLREVGQLLKALRLDHPNS